MPGGITVTECGCGDKPDLRDGESHAFASVHDRPNLRVTRASARWRPQAAAHSNQRAPASSSAQPTAPPVQAIAGRSLLPASILGITDIKVKGTLTDGERGQAPIRPSLRWSQPCHGAREWRPETPVHRH